MLSIRTGVFCLGEIITHGNIDVFTVAYILAYAVSLNKILMFLYFIGTQTRIKQQKLILKKVTYCN